jgi:hypothetical protein
MATVNVINHKRQNPGTMARVIKYVSREDKTRYNDRRLVSGRDCTPDTAFFEFMTTKQMHCKTGGVGFYHFVQSFHPDEKVTPEQAHEIALELAKQFDGFEVVVATHVDAEHIHSHLIVNSVSHVSGKKLHQSREDLMEHRRVSDEICVACGLMVLPSPGRKQSPAKGVQHREYRAAEKGQSWKFALMGTIDRCMDSSRTQAEFVAHMRSFGYGVDFNDGSKQRKTITYTTPKGYKCRDNRLHEPKYLKENMLHEFRFREIQSREYAFGATELVGTSIAFDETVPTPSLRHSARAMGRDRESFAIDRIPVQADPCSLEATVTRETVPTIHERDARNTSRAATAAIGDDGENRGENSSTGGENRQAVGADITTGWEASRQRLFDMQRAYQFPVREIAVDDRESVPVHGTGRSLAADILSLAKNVSKVGNYGDDLENIIALSALAGLSVAGAYKLIEMLQACDNTDITDRNVEEIIQELCRQP